MTPKDKLIAYMRLKASYLPKYKRQYFTKKDEKAIRKWEDADVKRVLSALVEAIKHKGLCNDTSTCVFCIKHSICGLCEYGKHHGICFEDGEDTSLFLPYRPRKSLYSKIIKNGEAISAHIKEHREELIKVLEGEE